MPNFTKGPWKFLVNNNDDLMTSFYGVSMGNNYTPVCTNRSKSDAHLIASAPEMYEMLENVLTEYKEMLGMSQEVKGIEQLLAKARGEHV